MCSIISRTLSFPSHSCWVSVHSQQRLYSVYTRASFTDFHNLTYMPRPRRTINRLRSALDGANAPAENPTDYSAMSTEALRLTLGERHLQQTGNRRELISRLQQNEQHRLPASQSESGPSNSSVATGGPNAELQGF